MRRSSLVLAAGALLLAGCRGGGASPRISVDHPVALIDEPLRITVTGLRPDERVVVRASTRDRSGKLFVAATTAQADWTGRIKLVGDGAMRLFWSLHPSGESPVADYFLAPPSRDERVTLRVPGAATVVRRELWVSGVRMTKLRPAADGFYGDFFLPPRLHRLEPGIVVFGGSEGGLATTGIAALYASHGYPTLALAYFGEPGLPRNLVNIPLEYFAHALHWLATQPGVDPRKLVVEGDSRGSEAAQLLGIDFPRLVHGVIAMVPANGPACGITRWKGAGVHCIGAAWTLHGKPILQYGAPSAYNPFPFADERIDGPIFFDCGGVDQLWPSCPMAESLVKRLQARRFRHRVTFLRYPDAGHGVGGLVPYRPGRYAPLEGATAQANAIAAANGWPKLLAFLRAIADGRYS